MSTQSPRVPGAEIGCRLRRRTGERNQRPFQGHTEVGRRLKPRIIARYDGKGEASPQRRLLLRPIQASDRRSPPASRAAPPQCKKGSVDRLTREELEALLSAAYVTSGICGLSLPGRAALVRLRAHAPCAAYGELSVGEGMISSESRMREICMSGSTSGDWKRSHGEE